MGNNNYDHKAWYLLPFTRLTLKYYDEQNDNDDEHCTENSEKKFSEYTTGQKVKLGIATILDLILWILLCIFILILIPVVFMVIVVLFILAAILFFIIVFAILFIIAVAAILIIIGAILSIPGITVALFWLVLCCPCICCATFVGAILGIAE